MKRFPFFSAASRKPKARSARRRLMVEPLEERSLLSGNVISGYVYVDANNDGLFETPGEKGLPGVTVQLLNASGTQIGTATTDGSGAYSFVDGTTTTQTESASLSLAPTNWIPGRTLTIPQFNPALGTLTGIQITGAGTIKSDISGQNNGTQPTAITATEQGNLTLTGPGLAGLSVLMSTSRTQVVPGSSPFDFGVQTANSSPQTSISPSMWSAYVGTGQVTLTDTATATASTSGSGNFTSQVATSASAQITVVYTYIPFSSYTIVDTPPPGYLDGLLSSGGSQIPGSVGKHSIAVTLVNPNSANNNFAELQPASVAGTVYLDKHQDGLKDADDPGIGGVTLTLKGTNDIGSVNLTTTTGGDGTYQFGNLRPGSYSVTETPPGGYLPGAENLGSAGGIIGSNQFVGIGLSNNVQGTGYNFGEVLPPGSLAGFVYLDSHNNGFKDPGESGIAGVAVTLTGTDNLGKAVNASAMTGSDGSYQFTNVRPGTYTLTETPPAHYLQGEDRIGSIGGIAGVDVFSSINVFPGAVGVNYNFGQLLPGSLAGFVYLDSNNNGIKDPGESGIAGVTLTITGTDNLGNAVSTAQTTASDGSYQFTNIRPGTYTLTETPPAHYLQGEDRIGSIGGIAGVDVFSSIAVASGAAGLNYNFGHQLPSSVSGFVFLDANNDGIFENGESGIAGVAITLTGTNDLGGSVRGTQLTGADGSYLFGNLLPGNYTISKTPPPAYIDGKEFLGSAGGNVAVDQFTCVNLPGGVAGANYNFAELLPPSGTGIIYSDFFSPNKATFPPPDLNILSKLQFLSNSGGQTIDPTTLAQATWVNGVYETLLNRPADSTGLLNWVILVHNGTPRPQVVSAIWNSAEHRTLEVDQFYQTFFNRAADSVGQAYWVNALLSGMSESQVAAAFVTSGEYAATHPTNLTYVMGLYADILGRSAPNQEVTGWLQQLNQGASRAAIAMAFLTSSESYQRIVSNDYLSYLSRSVDPAGLQSWLAVLQSGQATPASVTVAILASSEFYNDAVAAS
jgi:hypothetical protein